MADDVVKSSDENTAASKPKSKKGIKIQRQFSSDESKPFDRIAWEKRTAQITNEKGEVIFEQGDVEMPDYFSLLATNVVVSKYFKGAMGTPQREHSLKQLIGRVSGTIAKWGKKDGYFATEKDGERFHDELASLLVGQFLSFNSPVWFNVGVEERPQCSACFINSVDDTMESILTLSKTEGMLFKYGSGTGTNLSSLRSSYENITGGGIASGPVSFMRGFDAFAGVIKSGGKTRRAAKMVILNADHPDIFKFVECKVVEERKAYALIRQGYDAGVNGEAYGSVFFQNANHSVRITDDFMHSLLRGNGWSTRAVTDREKIIQTFPAEELMDKIIECAWETGDPGLQFHTTINDWHTCPNTAPINASNPCSEYMFLDDSACNLASLNLLKFRGEDGEFDVESMRHAVRIAIIAMEIIIENASYPTKEIERNSHEFRPLGLGYANLGALLMSRGLPYDSEDGRAYAATVTAIMHGEAYRTSAEIASQIGPFKGYARNRRPFLRVMRKHANALAKIERKRVPQYMIEKAEVIYDEMLSHGEKHGYRNAQVTVLAPTGTIAFMMDCDTTGIEPDIALVKYKKMVDGGMLKIVNHSVPVALRRLGYDDKTAEQIVSYLDENETIEGAPGLKPEHLPVFDCAFKPFKGDRSIRYMGHIRMMAVVQPFLSGAISKTVNMPNDITTKDIHEAYVASWQLGIKAIAIYRDGCKASQPLNTSQDSSDEEAEAKERKRVARKKLPDERKSITHKFSVGGHEGYITVGMYVNEKPGELFITMSKEGSTISGLMDSFATATSIALQYGVPLNVLVRKFIHMRFEPSGFTNNKHIPIAHSVMDYIFRWLALKFLPPEEHGLSQPEKDDTIEQPDAVPGNEAENAEGAVADNKSKVKKDNGHDKKQGNHEEVMAEARRIVMQVKEIESFVAVNQSDAPPCPTCGAIMVRSGSCYKCINCGATSGCS